MSRLVIRKAGKTLESAAEWAQHAAPAADGSVWIAGQAEFELAHAFFPKPGDAMIPEVLQKMMNSNPVIGVQQWVQGIPGYQVKPDVQSDSTHRFDLMGVTAGSEGRCALGIEAWTDGGFGPLIADQLKRSRPGSQWASGIQRLSKAVLSVSAAESGHLRSGLIHAAAAALRAAEIEKAAIAVLVFYEFRPRDGRGQQRHGNLSALDALSAALGGQPLKEGVLSGPFRVPGGSDIPASVPLFLGRLVSFLPVG